MPLYTFTARNKEGKIQKGTVDAPTEKAAAGALRDKGFIVVSLKVGEERFGIKSLWKKFRGVKVGEKVNFTRQLATMMAAGLPLASSLEILERQTKNEAMREVISGIVRDVQGGTALSQSLSKSPSVFSPTYLSLVRAGEASGTVDSVLGRLADSLEKDRDFRSKVKGALIYPAIVTIAMLAVFVIMMVFVVPKLSEMYENLGAELPLATQILMGVASLFTTRWWLLALILVGGGTGIYFFKKSSYGKYRLAEISLKLPIFGKLNKQAQLTELTRTLGLLLGAGVSIAEALEIVSGTTGNVLYQDSVREAAKSVSRGVPLSTPLRADPNFPPLVPQMISVGEETGRMDEVLLKVSSYFEKEVEHTIKGLSTVLEPLIMIVLGVMVGLLVLSIITPIYKLTAQF